MCRTRTLVLTTRQRRALVRVRNRHPKPYVREKAAALLKVADGWTLQDVAGKGLLRRRPTPLPPGWTATRPGAWRA